MTLRPLVVTSEAQPATERAGVCLRSLFGFEDLSLTDPSLMMDGFRNNDPSLCSLGFSLRPHRGIATITSLLVGQVGHADSPGNCGVLGAGSVQWMTAGTGIVHQDLPSGNAIGLIHGFPLWASLPSVLKMTSLCYQDISVGDIPIEGDGGGTTVKVIIGSFWGKTGPVDGISANPRLLDVSVPA